MSRLQQLFQKKDRDILNVYCTAGFPNLDSTLTVMRSLEENGADIIELGIPYSDPLADGPVIQESSSIAIANGMSLAKLFEQLKEFRKIIQVPVVLMGYMNPVLQYGFKKFCADASEVGIDGLILPDLPQYEFETLYGPLIREYGLDFIFLVTPETSSKRIKKLDELSTGFLYAVSSSSTTGTDKQSEEVETYLVRLKKLKLRNPILVGFGIKDRDTFRMATQHANGAIIGSAYIRALGQGPEIEESTRSFLSGIRG
jgi:tryptophan synthase alpha chain